MTGVLIIFIGYPVFLALQVALDALTGWTIADALGLEES